MSIYTPDSWVIVKISGPTGDDSPVYKVLAGWSGGYLDGDSWRANSGIGMTKTFDDHYEFVGYSGSIYVCDKRSEGMRLSMYPGWSPLEAAAEGSDYTVEIVTAKEYLIENEPNAGWPPQ